MRIRKWKKVCLLITVALTFPIGLPASVFAADASYKADYGDNSTISNALRAASPTDTITLSGSGMIMFGAGDEISAAVVISPDEGDLVLSGGIFKNTVTVNSGTDEYVVFQDSQLSELIVSSPLRMEGCVVSNEIDAPVKMMGGRLELSDETTVRMAGDMSPEAAVEISGNVDEVAIGEDCTITSQYRGVLVTGSGVVLGTLSIRGMLQGAFRAVSISEGATMNLLEVGSSGRLKANGGAGVAAESDASTIVKIDVEEGGVLEGNSGGVSCGMNGAIGVIQVCGEVSGLYGGAGILNSNGIIDTILVSGGAINGVSAGISNIYSASNSVIGSITVQGGQIWGKGKSGSNGIGIVNMGGTINLIDVKQGGFIDGGSSTQFQGFGIYNVYFNQKARIGVMLAEGAISGMDGEDPFGADQGGIGVYNRGSEIDDFQIGLHGTIHGELAGIYNNYDTAAAEIKKFTNQGRVMSGSNSLVNSPEGNGGQASIGSASFDVESGGQSLLRGRTRLGQIGGNPIDEFVPDIQSSFSEDCKKLTVTCRAGAATAPAIEGLYVQLFCLEEGSLGPIAITDVNGQASFSFTERFADQGNTYWIYTFAHFDEENRTLYSSTKVDLPKVPDPPSTSSGSSGSSLRLTGNAATGIGSINVNGKELNPTAIDPLKKEYVAEVAPKDGSAYVTIPLPLIRDWGKKNLDFAFILKTDLGSCCIPMQVLSDTEALTDVLKKTGAEEKNTALLVSITVKPNPGLDASLAERFPQAQILGNATEFHAKVIDLSREGMVISDVNGPSGLIQMRIILPKVTDQPLQYGAFRYDEQTRELSFVPHRLVLEEGKQYMEIQSASGGFFAAAKNEVNFSDVGDSFWGRTVIEKAAAKGLVQGYGRGLYCPQEEVSRAEFVEMVVNAVGKGSFENKTGNPAYADVKSTDWFFRAVSQAEELKLLRFAEEKDFKPNQPIKREEMASILAATLQAQSWNSSSAAVDLSGIMLDYGEADQAFMQDLTIVYDSGLMQGNGDGYFNFKGSANRAEAAAVLVRLLEKLRRID